MIFCGKTSFCFDDDYDKYGNDDDDEDDYYSFIVPWVAWNSVALQLEPCLHQVEGVHQQNLHTTCDQGEIQTRMFLRLSHQPADPTCLWKQTKYLLKQAKQEHSS